MDEQKQIDEVDIMKTRFVEYVKNVINHSEINGGLVLFLKDDNLCNAAYFEDYELMLAALVGMAQKNKPFKKIFLEAAKIVQCLP